MAEPRTEHDCVVVGAVPSGNTNAPSIMVGEKASDLLRGQS